MQLAPEAITSRKYRHGRTTMTAKQQVWVIHHEVSENEWIELALTPSLATTHAQLDYKLSLTKRDKDWWRGATAALLATSVYMFKARPDPEEVVAAFDVAFKTLIDAFANKD